jgi:hypothetical protein
VYARGDLILRGRVEKRVRADQVKTMNDIAGQVDPGERGHVVADDALPERRLMDSSGL